MLKALNRLPRILNFLVPPLFFIIPGALLSSAYSDINWLPLFTLYFFILINQALETLISHFNSRDITKILITEVINIFLIIYFYIHSSFFFGNILLFYSLFIHSQYLFKKYKLHHLAIILLIFFKIIVMNGISFYLSAYFIPFTIILKISPFILPFSLMELDRWGKATPILKLSIIFFSYLAGIAILWLNVSFWSLLIFFSLPSVYYALDWNNYQGSKVFYSTFSMTLFLILFLF